jgi:replicative DNA helicase
LLRQIAIMGAAGLHPFTAEQVRPCRVLVLDAENSERQWRRAVRSLAQAAGDRGVQDPRDAMSVEFLRRIDITRASDQGMLHRLVDEAKPDLVLIGPLYRLVPKAIKDDDDAAPVIAALDTIRDRGVTMMVEAHAGHATNGSGARELRPRGSSALLGWPEFGLGLAKPAKAGDPHHLVRWRGDRDERSWPAELTSARYSAQHWPWMPTGSYWGGVDAAPQSLI